MYVTDVPVVDRLTDRFAHETFLALDKLETALSDLEGWIEEASPDYKPTSWQAPSTSAEIHQGLSDALNMAAEGLGHADDALTLAL